MDTLMSSLLRIAWGMMFLNESIVQCHEIMPKKTLYDVKSILRYLLIDVEQWFFKSLTDKVSPRIKYKEW